MGLPEAVLRPLEGSRWQGQQELLALSSCARHIVARGSGHYVHWTHPELVVDAIRSLLPAEAR